MMAASLRLNFLYPHLFRPSRWSDATLVATKRQSRTGRLDSLPFSTCSRRRELNRFSQRHGKAVEPFLPDGVSREDVKVYTREKESQRTTGDTHKPTSQKQAKPALRKEPSSSLPLSKETQDAAIIPGDETFQEPISSPRSPTPLQEAALNTNSDDTLGKVLLMDPPTEPPTDPSIPHLAPPPYVHHFDSWTLVKQVEVGGFTDAQAITAMKAVRGLLAHNLDIAKEGLVSASDVENETYLFRAACSELRTEIQNTRRATDEKMRRERTLLQHEVDTLNLKLTQELLTLKDDLRGMFNDRKMLVREEQRLMDSKIQEVNYKITVLLNSDSKSEVEGLRWVLTRRSVLGILFMAFMVLSSLRYASYRSHQDEIEAKRAERQRILAKKNGHNLRYVDGVAQTEDGQFVATTAAEALAAAN